jgi:putative membrane protein
MERREVAASPQRYLVLCVDRDDDMGKKTGLETPIVGREAAVAAATKLALADPEEADSNAVFCTVKKYDELVAKGVDCEVAVVCGDSGGGFGADRKVGMETAAVLDRVKATGIVFVSDGGDDEQVMPILQSLKPIVSVQRVTVKHSETVEETYLVLGRYLRMLIFDERYSKWTLGVPGVIFLLAGILVISGQVFDAELATLLILGGVFFIRGFNVDRTIAGLLHRGPTGYMRLFSTVTSVLVVLVGVFTGYGYMVQKATATILPGGENVLQAVAGNPSLFFVYGGLLIGSLINGSLVLVWVGLAIYSTGALLSHVARDSVRWRRDAFVIVMLALLYFPVDTFSAFLIQGGAVESYLLIDYVLIGLAAIFVLTAVIYPRVRTRETPQKE